MRASTTPTISPTTTNQNTTVKIGRPKNRICGQWRPFAILLKSFTPRRIIGASISGHPAAEAAGGTSAVSRGLRLSREVRRSEQRFSVLSALVTTFYPYPEPRPNGPALSWASAFSFQLDANGSGIGSGSAAGVSFFAPGLRRFIFAIYFVLCAFTSRRVYWRGCV